MSEQTTPAAKRIKRMTRDTHAIDPYIAAVRTAVVQGSDHAPQFLFATLRVLGGNGGDQTGDAAHGVGMLKGVGKVGSGPCDMAQ